MIVHQVPYDPGATDAHGNHVDAWGQQQPVEAHGWYTTSTSEQVDGRATTTERLTLLVPPGLAVGVRDRFVVERTCYQVDGPPRWYTASPFGYGPGGELSLLRVEGG